MHTKLISREQLRKEYRAIPLKALVLDMLFFFLDQLVEIA